MIWECDGSVLCSGEPKNLTRLGETLQDAVWGGAFVSKGDSLIPRVGYVQRFVHHVMATRVSRYDVPFRAGGVGSLCRKGTPLLREWGTCSDSCITLWRLRVSRYDAPFRAGGSLC